MKPIVNKVRCKKCNDIIESKHRYDMVWCKCGSIYIDGGNEYQRYGWPGGEVNDWVDFSYSKYRDEIFKK